MSQLMDQAKQLRGRYVSNYTPMESAFVDRRNIAQGERDQYQGRNVADIEGMGKTDLRSRLGSRLIAGPGSNSLVGDITDNAISRARAVSDARVGTENAMDQQQNSRRFASAAIGQGLLSGANAGNKHSAQLGEADEQSRYDFNQTYLQQMGDMFGTLSTTYFPKIKDKIEFNHDWSAASAYMN